MTRDNITNITLGYAITMTLITGAYVVAGVVAILPAIIISITSWLPYYGTKAYYN